MNEFQLTGHTDDCAIHDNDLIPAGEFSFDCSCGYEAQEAKRRAEKRKLEDRRLLPCPFCGCKDIRQSVTTSRIGTESMVFCDGCGANIVSTRDPVPYWYKRATPDGAHGT
jgi:hypothetical protein